MHIHVCKKGLRQCSVIDHTHTLFPYLFIHSMAAGELVKSAIIKLGWLVRLLIVNHFMSSCWSNCHMHILFYIDMDLSNFGFKCC